jgi:beta-lactamase class A
MTVLKSKSSRRAILAALLTVPVLGSARARAPAAAPQVRLKSLEDGTKGGRLGVAILDTALGGVIGYRMDERFGMCSTFKLPLVAAILHKGDVGHLRLDEIVPYTKKDMVPHAPVTGPNLAKGGMTVQDLAEAAQKTSDNVAANLLIKRLGGPEAVTKIWRGWGDPITRIDRYEPEMNRVKPDEDRDCTSPYAMAGLLETILTGDVLKPRSRTLLIRWMVETQTGARRLRAGLPDRWKAGDKTGTMTGQKDLGNKTNDVAIAWPPGRRPVVIAAFLESPHHGDSIRDEDQQVLAGAGRIAADWIGG